jgi:hypothetical protein
MRAPRFLTFVSGGFVATVLLGGCAAVNVATTATSLTWGAATTAVSVASTTASVGVSTMTTAGSLAASGAGAVVRAATPSTAEPQSVETASLE